MNTLVIICRRPAESLYILSEELASRGEALRFLLRNKKVDRKRLSKIGEVFEIDQADGVGNVDYDCWVKLMEVADRVISWR